MEDYELTRKDFYRTPWKIFPVGTWVYQKDYETKTVDERNLGRVLAIKDGEHRDLVQRWCKEHVVLFRYATEEWRTIWDEVTYDDDLLVEAYPTDEEILEWDSDLITR